MTLEHLSGAVEEARSADRARAAGRDGRDKLWWPWLAIGWLLQAGVRLVLAAGQTTPVATPDETGYLYAARLLTGGPAGADLTNTTHYRGGYSLLILPAFWLTDDPWTCYRIAIVINALVAAVILVLAYQLLRRLGLTPRWGCAVAHVTALLPAGVFYTQFALTDAVLPVVVLGWLLLLHSWLVTEASEAKAALYGAGASCLAGYAYMAHSRGMVIVAVHAGLLLLAAVRRWRPWWSVRLGALITADVVIAGWLLNNWIWRRLYPGGSWDMGSMVVERLTTLDGYGWTIPVGLGQIWYLIVATWGLAGIGLVAVMAIAVGRGVPSRQRAMAVVVIVTVVGIAFATAAALPDEQRVGNHAYSRYLSCLAPTLFAVGAVVLLRARHRTAVCAAGLVSVLTVAGTAMIELNAGAKFGDYRFDLFDFPETGFLTWDWTSLRLWRATLAALGLLVFMVVASRWRRRGAVVLAVALTVVNAMASTAAALQISRPVDRSAAAASDLSSLVDPAAKPRVAVDQRIAWRIQLRLAYQISWSQVLWFNGGTQRPPPQADLVLVYWGHGVPAGRTWTNPPYGWWVAHARSYGGWVAWDRR